MGYLQCVLGGTEARVAGFFHLPTVQGPPVGPVGALRVQSVWMKGGHSGSASDAPRTPDMGSFPFSPSPQQLPAFITVIKNEL